MSIILPKVDLSAASVGSTGNVSWEQQAVRGSIEQINTIGNGAIQVYNESGCGLSVALHQSNETSFIPAGGWRQIALAADDVSIDYTVLYVIPNAPVTALIVVYYKPAEAVDLVGVLGNSPIGLSGSVQTSVTQVIQDGQPIAQTILESTPSGGGGQTLLITTDGIIRSLGAGINPFIWNGKLSAANRIVLNSHPTDQADNWALIHHTNGDFSLDDTPLAPSIRFGANGGGVVAMVGQTAAGTFGLPLGVKIVEGFGVVSTANVLVATFTPTANGLYRISLYISLHNGTTPQNLTATLKWTDVNTATLITANWSTTGGVLLDGTHAIANGAYAGIPFLVEASTASAISVNYQDPLNTPADSVSVTIERLN